MEEAYGKEGYTLSPLGIIECACEDAHKAAGITRTSQDNIVIRSPDPEAFDKRRANRHTPAIENNKSRKSYW
jgi:hypothetical protein